MYGNPIPKVTWYKDNVLITENKAEGRLILEDESLVIQKARRSSKHDDTGVYYCVAKNEIGSDRSNNATVRVRCKYNNKIDLTGHIKSLS